MHGLTTTAERSLAQGADVDTVMSEYWPYYRRSNRLYGHPYAQVTPLEIAIAHQQECLAILLIERGAKINFKLTVYLNSISALHMASGLGLVKLMQVLMDRGL